MELMEAKRELNNVLFRMYKSTGDENKKLILLQELVNYNIDLVGYVIYNEFPNKEINYMDGVNGLLSAINNYEMDKMCSFEEFILSNVRNNIINNIKEPKKRF